MRGEPPFTFRDLSEDIRKRRFREDLYYRLNVYPNRVPPLRERPEDLEPLLDHFVRQFAADNNFRPKSFSPEAVELMRRHAWRGNVRELRNTVERLMIMVADAEVGVEHLREVLRPSGGPLFPGGAATLKDFKETSERAFLVQKLRESGWNISATAQAIDTPRSNLYKKLEQYAISQEKDG